MASFKLVGLGAFDTDFCIVCLVILNESNDVEKTAQ